MVPFLGHPVYTNGASSVGYITDIEYIATVTEKYHLKQLQVKQLGRQTIHWGLLLPFLPM